VQLGVEGDGAGGAVLAVGVHVRVREVGGVQRDEVAIGAEVRLQVADRAAGARGGMSAAYLVERGVVPRFRAVVQRLQRDHADLALLCTGPWPPYSFVDLSDTPKPALAP
jgi:hypothetical protein